MPKKKAAEPAIGAITGSVTLEEGTQERKGFDLLAATLPPGLRPSNSDILRMALIRCETQLSPKE